MRFLVSRSSEVEGFVGERAAGRYCCKRETGDDDELEEVAGDMVI